jgi:23S rRNA pseudouridine1911/1915/1917 synthase
MADANRPGEGAPREAERDVVTTEVPALLAGVRVDRVVAMVANVSRSVAAELVASGRVLVDGVPVPAGRTELTEGARLTVQLPDPDTPVVEAERDVPVDVVSADDEVVVVDKPAGLVVHPGAGNSRGTLVAGLLARFPDLEELVRAGRCPPERPGIVHRLDKGTSGLLVVARTEGAYDSLVRQLAARTVERRYVALVRGTLADDRGEVEAPIGRSARTPTKMAVTAAGRPARTSYRVLERVPGATLVELALQTGRTHQIRVHMAAIGHPVVGDARYGTPERSLGGGRVFLHARRLAFIHPGSQARVVFTSDLPEDLRAYLESTRP